MQKNLDFEIWQRFQNGDTDAFAYIFDTYHVQLFEYGGRFSANGDLVRDSIQDLFMELATRKGKLSPTDNILFYLLKSVRLRILSNLKKVKVDATVELSDNFSEPFLLNYSGEMDELEKELKLDQLGEAINQLPARQKETIYLKFYKNLSNSEVAEVMQVNYQTVGNNIQKAIQKLKAILQSDADTIILFFQKYLR